MYKIFNSSNIQRRFYLTLAWDIGEATHNTNINVSDEPTIDGRIAQWCWFCGNVVVEAELIFHEVYVVLEVATENDRELGNNLE